MVGELRQKQQGATLVVVLLLLVLMLALAISLASNTSTHAVIANNSVLQKQAFQSAGSGIDILYVLFNQNPEEVEKVRNTSCDKALTSQYQYKSTALQTEAEVTDVRGRKTTLQWYACSPSKEKSKSCPDGGECFSVLVTGVACPQGVAIGADLSQCVLSRQLQGYALVD